MPRLPRSRILAALALALAAAGPVQARPDCADVGLVLSIDASSSISNAEYMLQIEGYRHALTHPSVRRAVEQAGIVDIAGVLWGDSGYTPQIIGWQRITEPDQARAFADQLAGTERRVSGNTDIGTGLMASIDLFQEPGRCFIRKVIDVSGDGRASVIARRPDHKSVHAARKRADQLGITVNALAITADERDLASYFRKTIMTGPASFVMEVGSFEGFREAIVQKLMQELLSAAEAPVRTALPRRS
jgi:hypothetical protein